MHTQNITYFAQLQTKTAMYYNVIL